MTESDSPPAQDHPSSAPSVASRTRGYLARIDRLDSEIHAFTDSDADRALATARDLDGLHADRRGLLYGMNVAVKDNIDTGGSRCAAGIAALRDRIAIDDAPVVARLRAEDAVILGVTATDSGAFGVTTPNVTNPVLPDRVVGGSSGGAAAAVAAGLCDAALGTDTGGSVRIPAACCGIFGFKPTVNTLPTDDVRPLSPRFDHVGFIANSIQPLRQLLSAFVSESTDVQGQCRARIGVPWSGLEGIEPGMSDALERVCGKLRGSGHSIHDVDFPSFDDVQSFHLVLSLADAAAEYARHPVLGCTDLPMLMEDSLDLGRSYTQAEIARAEAERDDFLSQVSVLFSNVDYLLLPTLPCAPPRREDESVIIGRVPVPVLNALIRFTAPFNQTGQPVLSFPDPTLAAEFPVSFQLVGRTGGDAALLAFADGFLTRRNCERPSARESGSTYPEDNS